MGSASKFSALNTKLQAMDSKLVSLKDYDILLGLDTEREIGNYIKHNTRYARVLSEYSIDRIRRWEFELVLRKEIITDIEKLTKYLPTHEKKFIEAIFLRSEVEDIKLILRAVSRKEDLKELPQHFEHSKKHETVSFERLLSNNSLFDLGEEFRGTIFEEAFRSITEEDLKLREFHAEMNLDSVYFRELRKRAEKLSTEDKAIVEHIIGVNIDLINIQWIYRAKRYYNLMDEEIFNYTLLGGEKLNLKKIKNIIYSEDSIDLIIKMLEKYGIILNPNDDKYLQVMINRHLLEMMTKLDKANPMTMAKLVRYVHDSEFESHDLITILEGVRYKNKEIKKLLVKGGEKAWQ